jgi:adenylate kinase
VHAIILAAHTTSGGAEMNSGDKNDRAAWLKGPSIKCSGLPEKLNRPWRLVLLGPPGVGKGTQADLLTRRLGACHLSTGDLFRDAKHRSEREQTLAMGAALNFMKRGALVPDAIVWELIRERTSCLHCQGGFVLDGFPRTLAQAKALQVLLENERLSLDAVVTYELPGAEIISRLSGRRTCEKCKAIFHQTAQPPRIEGICDRCGGALFQRDDDRPESIAVRLDAYEHSTAPLIQFYRSAGLLTLVVATGSPEEIFQRTMTILESRVKRTGNASHSEQSAVFAP